MLYCLSLSFYSISLSDFFSLIYDLCAYEALGSTFVISKCIIEINNLNPCLVRLQFALESPCVPLHLQITGFVIINLKHVTLINGDVNVKERDRDCVSRETQASTRTRGKWKKIMSILPFSFLIFLLAPLRAASHVQSPAMREPLRKPTVYTPFLSHTHSFLSIRSSSDSLIFTFLSLLRQLVYICFSSLTCSLFSPSPRAHMHIQAYLLTTVLPH